MVNWTERAALAALIVYAAIAAFIKTEIPKYAKIIKASGAKAD